jgi:uncharacterized protein YegL
MKMRPGGELATRPLEFIWLADCSVSMRAHGKIEALNEAIRKSIPFMQEVAYENPNAQVYVRAVKFSSGAHWHLEDRTPVEDFQWKDLEAEGVTDLGEAFYLLKEALKVAEMSERALPPVIVLVSDGQPTDDYRTALKSLLEEPWAVKAVKIAIGIGKSASKRVLKEFCGENGIEVLSADNAETLVEYIKWVSTVVLQAASSPASQADNQTTMGINVSIPLVDEEFEDLEMISVEDVW